MIWARWENIGFQTTWSNQTQLEVVRAHLKGNLPAIEDAIVKLEDNQIEYEIDWYGNCNFDDIFYVVDLGFDGEEAQEHVARGEFSQGSLPTNDIHVVAMQLFYLGETMVVGSTIVTSAFVSVAGASIAPSTSHSWAPTTLRISLAGDSRCPIEEPFDSHDFLVALQSLPQPKIFLGGCPWLVLHLGYDGDFR